MRLLVNKHLRVLKIYDQITKVFEYQALKQALYYFLSTGDNLIIQSYARSRLNKLQTRTAEIKILIQVKLRFLYEKKGEKRVL